MIFIFASLQKLTYYVKFILAKLQEQTYSIIFIFAIF